MSPVGNITIYESQLFRAYGAPTAAVRDFYSKNTLQNSTSWIITKFLFIFEELYQAVAL